MIASTFKLVLLAATFVSPLVFAQNNTEGNIPACVSTCITSAATVAGCSPTDTNCLCTQSQFAYAVGNCIGVSCSVANINTGRTAVLDLCGLEDSEPAEGGAGSTNTTNVAQNSTASAVSGSSNSTTSAVARPSVVRATGTGGVSWQTIVQSSTSTSSSSSSVASASGAVANVAAAPSSSATSPASSSGSASSSAASATSTAAQSGGASANLPARWMMGGVGIAAILLLGA